MGTAVAIGLLLRISMLVDLLHSRSIEVRNLLGCSHAGSLAHGSSADGEDVSFRVVCDDHSDNAVPFVFEAHAGHTL